MTKLIYLLLAAAIGIQLFIHYPALPDRMASHYDFAGNPNDWMSKQGLVAFYLGTSGFVLGLFALIPRLLRILPTSLINMPNKDYWLAPERKEASLAVMGVYMDVFAAGVGVLLVTVFEMTFRANEGGDGRLPFPGIVLGAFLAFTVAWIVALTRRFRKPAAV